MKITRVPWKREELKILRDAWVVGMTAKGISSTLLPHRTTRAITQVLIKHGMTLSEHPDRKPIITVSIGLPEYMVEQLKSSAVEQGVSVSKLCRNIIQEWRPLDVERTEISRREYCREQMREWRARQRQKSAAE